MIKNKNIFLGKKILIYGLGKSGIASYKFLKNKAKVYLFDDNLKKNLKSIKSKTKNIQEYLKLSLIVLLLVQELIF